MEAILATCPPQCSLLVFTLLRASIFLEITLVVSHMRGFLLYLDTWEDSLGRRSGRSGIAAKAIQNVEDKHPCLKRNSNPRSHRSSDQGLRSGSRGHGDCLLDCTSLTGAPMPDRSKVMTQTKWDTLVLQVGGWAWG
jgi:hypothetical protein